MEKPTTKQGEQLNVTAAHSLLNDELSFKEIIIISRNWILYILSKWVFILFAALIGASVGLVYALNQSPIYKAELTFALEDEEGSSGGGYAGLASQFGLNVGGGGGGAFAGDNLLELMKSRSLVEKALLTSIIIDGREKTLAEYYIDFNKLRDAWDSKPKLKGIRFPPRASRSEFTLQQDSILGKIYKSILGSYLIVDKKDKQLGIFFIKVQSGDELFSKAFTEVLAKEVTEFYVDTKTKKSVQNLEILQHQTDSVKRALYAALSGVASSIDVNPNPNAALRVLTVPSKRREVEVQANQAILTELVKNLEMSKMSLRRETPFIQVIDKPILPLEKEQFGKRRGVLLGGIIGGFLALSYFLIKRFLKHMLS